MDQMEHELSFEEIKVLREAARVKMKNTLVSYIIMEVLCN